jgi:predicted dehydrogenase
MRRICLIGAGSIARTHAEVLRSLPGVSVVAIADPRPAAAEALSRLLPERARWPRRRRRCRMAALTLRMF